MTSLGPSYSSLSMPKQLVSLSSRESSIRVFEESSKLFKLDDEITFLNVFYEGRLSLVNVEAWP